MNAAIYFSLFFFLRILLYFVLLYIKYLNFISLENGEFLLQRNNHSWNEVADVLYVEQPLRTGFSLAARGAPLVRSEDEVGRHFRKFLLSFLSVFDEYKGEHAVDDINAFDLYSCLSFKTVLLFQASIFSSAARATRAFTFPGLPSTSCAIRSCTTKAEKRKETLLSVSLRC